MPTSDTRDWPRFYYTLIRKYEAQLERSKAKGVTPQTIASHERSIRHFTEMYEIACKRAAEAATPHQCPICRHTC